MGSNRGKQLKMVAAVAVVLKEQRCIKEGS